MKSIRFGLFFALLLAFDLRAESANVHELEVGGVVLRVELDGAIPATECTG